MAIQLHEVEFETRTIGPLAPRQCYGVWSSAG